MAEYKPTVIDSQVLNWLGYISPEKVKTVLISVLRAGQLGITENMALDLEKRFGIKYLEFRPINIVFLRDLHVLIYVLLLYLRNVCSTKLIIQARFLALWQVYLLCNWLPRLRLVYEARGSALVETQHLIATCRVPKRPLRIIDFRERTCVTLADCTICVSQKMKDYFLRKYAIRKPDHLVVIPGVADSNLIFCDDKIRTAMRERLGLERKKVFLYSGRLDKEWQQPDQMFKMFSEISNQDEDYFFLVLTPDLEIAKDKFHHFGIASSDYHAEYVSFDKLNDYLNASDYGVLLRQDLPINNQASPTKFAEYLIAGLRIVISQNVGDFSEFVKEHELGAVINNDKLQAVELLESLSKISYTRHQINQIGVKYFSKESYIKLMESAVVG